jgi:hypothetical protein
MSQHVYTLKFTISISNPPDGTYLSQSESRDVKPELLTQEIGPDGATKEDVIKAQIEEKIKQVIPTVAGAINVTFDSLVESE